MIRFIDLKTISYLGLFSKAIVQSGSPLNHWALYPDPKKQSQRFAVKFGCPVNNSKEMIACLKKVDGEEFVNAHREMTVITCKHSHTLSNNNLNEHPILGTPKRFYNSICPDN